MSERTYRANTTCTPVEGRVFRFKFTCTGHNKLAARLDAERRARVMFPSLRNVRVGGLKWLREKEYKG
jgi:hypothetical protein